MGSLPDSATIAASASPGPTERIAKLEGGAEPEIEAEPLVHDPEYGQLYGGHTYAQVKWMHEHGDWQQQGIQVPTAFEAQKWLNEDTTPRLAGL